MAMAGGEVKIALFKQMFFDTRKHLTGIKIIELLHQNANGKALAFAQ